MKMTSPVFENHQPVPTPYTCKEGNVNPPLEWHDVPPNAKSLVLMFEDVDAPANPWVHWLVFNIPPETTGCAANALPEGSTEGIANGGTFGYEGPCPKYFSGTHHYLFRLFALDTVLDLPANSDRSAVLSAMQSHILEEAQLVGLAEGEAETTSA
jgi:Raf kinase inhibitor-like YbhB/YbcL family protein